MCDRVTAQAIRHQRNQTAAGTALDLPPTTTIFRKLQNVRSPKYSIPNQHYPHKKKQIRKSQNNNNNNSKRYQIMKFAIAIILSLVPAAILGADTSESSPAHTLRAHSRRVEEAEADTCKDDPSWYRWANGKQKTCRQVQNSNPERRCEDWVSHDGIVAKDACFKTCGTCTSSPTYSPTTTPTELPTHTPTMEPTSIPTLTPSEFPTYADVADCKLLVAFQWTTQERDDFCNAHEQKVEGTGCCNGGQACASWNPEITYKICKGSCRGTKACKNIARQSIPVQGSKVKIGLNACVGENSCENMGYEQGKEIKVEDTACVGDSSCARLGEDYGEHINIGTGACDGTDSCFGLGFRGPKIIDIESLNCVGGFACQLVGDENFVSIEIAGNSCVGEDSCKWMDCNNAADLNICNSKCSATACA